MTKSLDSWPLPEEFIYFDSSVDDWALHGGKWNTFHRDMLGTCQHDNPATCYTLRNDKARLVWHVCRNCRKIVKGKQTDVIDVNTLPSRARVFREISQDSTAVVTRLAQLKLDIDRMLEERRTAEEDTFWQDYRRYLQSDKWRAKRDRVMARDDNTCQACLNRNAWQVHHLTYVHLYNEPLFDLVAVCKVCHDAITNMDRERAEVREIVRLLSCNRRTDGV